MSNPAMPLSQFAWRVAGPRDLVINWSLNTLIAYLVLGGMDRVPLVGWLSVLIMLGPMCFLLASLTTFFGCLAGALGRMSGHLQPPLAPRTPWLARAVRAGLAAGVVTLSLGLLVIWGLHLWKPGLDFPAGPTVAGIGLLAGVLAYFLHARAVLLSARLRSD